MIIKLPALVADQEMAMVDWQRIQSFELIPVRVRIRIERKWEKKKVGDWLPKGILPPGAKRRKLYMTKYCAKPMETKQEFQLDPNKPDAIHTLFKFCSKKWPQNTWYIIDIWFLNKRKGPFEGRIMQYHLATLQKIKNIGNVKGLKLHQIDGKDALLFDVTPNELETSDNGYADDVCKRRLEAPEKIETVSHSAACGIF